MIDREAIEKAIEIAIENGYRGYTIRNFIVNDNYPYLITHVNHDGSVPLTLGVHSTIFSHDFAKAFFSKFIKKYGGARKYSIDTHYIDSGESLWLEDWEYHLMMMVREENPIDYLRKFILDEQQD